MCLDVRRVRILVADADPGFVVRGGGWLFGAVVLADVVDADEVRGAGDAGRGAGRDDDGVALFAAADLQELFVDLGDHGVGGVDVRAEEGLYAPCEVEL